MQKFSTFTIFSTHIQKLSFLAYLFVHHKVLPIMIAAHFLDCLYDHWLRSNHFWASDGLVFFCIYARSHFVAYVVQPYRCEGPSQLRIRGFGKCFDVMNVSAWLFPNAFPRRNRNLLWLIHWHQGQRFFALQQWQGITTATDSSLRATTKERLATQFVYFPWFLIEWRPFFGCCVTKSCRYVGERCAYILTIIRTNRAEICHGILKWSVSMCEVEPFLME